MKCLLVGDIHYSLKQYDWIHQVAPKFDVVIIAGDLLDFGSAVDKEAQILVVLKYLRHMHPHTELLVCSGNHDGNGSPPENQHTAVWLAQARSQGAWIDGDSLLKDGILFTICPWRFGPEPKKAILDQLRTDSRKEKKKWVWVYHEPPLASPVSWTGKTHHGDSVLREWIEEFQPDMVCSGHAHQAPFQREGSWVDRLGSTWVFNMGRQVGAVPSFIVIDLAEEKALWFSQAGRERVALDKPFTPDSIAPLA